MVIINRVVFQVRFGSTLYNGLPCSFVYNREETDPYHIVDFDFETALHLYMEKKNDLKNVVLTQTPYLCEDDWIEYFENIGYDEDDIPSYPNAIVIKKSYDDE